jgi:simple sugar transport system permease protein
MDFFVNWIANVPSFAVPFALAGLGLIVTEKSGVLNLGAEGFMLVGALTGAGTMLVFGQQPLLALVVAALSASLLSMLFGLLVVTMRVNQVISGFTIVFFAQGLTAYISASMKWTNRPFAGLGNFDLGPLASLPIVGRILFEQDFIVYLTPILFLIVVYVLTSTNFGLRLRAVGENPEAADAAGISVAGYRFFAIMAGAMLLGLAGGYITIAVSKIWVDGVTGGRGWIAVALVIFARWYPWRAFFGALLFGSIEALIPRMAAAGLALPQYFVLMLPYAVTLAVMIWTSLSIKGRQSGQPSALGEPFVREQRR